MAKDKKTETANDNPESQNSDNNALPIVVHTQYIKDMSLEIPHAPEIFRNLDQNPEINIDVNVDAKHLHDNFFNIALVIKINGIIKSQPLFVMDLEYAAIVSINNVPQEHLEPVLLVEIPRLLFPFARSIITTTLINGGLPPFMINPIDFVAMFHNRKITPTDQK